LTARTIAVALPLLTVGIGIGFAWLESEGRGFDPVVALGLVAWVVYGAFLALRLELGWRGRRTAWLALAGFVLVLVLHVALTPMTHL
jgi:ABC-type transport system involved in cytochrome c biogenesis permease subunit